MSAQGHKQVAKCQPVVEKVCEQAHIKEPAPAFVLPSLWQLLCPRCVKSLSISVRSLRSYWHFPSLGDDFYLQRACFVSLERGRTAVHQAPGKRSPRRNLFPFLWSLKENCLGFDPASVETFLPLRLTLCDRRGPWLEIIKMVSSQKHPIWHNSFNHPCYLTYFLPRKGNFSASGPHAGLRIEPRLNTTFLSLAQVCRPRFQ